MTSPGDGEADLLDPALLRALLRYDPDTGLLFWRPRSPEMFLPRAAMLAARADRWNARHAGRPAFALRQGGYCCGELLRRRCYAHRVVWAIHHGRWPRQQIDHINGVRDDNRIANLREVSASENQRNRRRPLNNTSGAVGVSWCRKSGKWRATIQFVDGIVSLGTFDDKQAAIDARKAAERRFGFHENHGRDG